MSSENKKTIPFIIAVILESVLALFDGFFFLMFIAVSAKTGILFLLAALCVSPIALILLDKFGFTKYSILTFVAQLFLSFIVFIGGIMSAPSSKSENPPEIAETETHIVETIDTTESVETTEETESETETETETYTETQTETETETETEMQTESETELQETTEKKLRADLLYGDLLDYNDQEDTAIIKARITSQMTNKMTIDQNYYNVEHLVQDCGFDKYSEIQYWAVAKMMDGSESKVIQFTIGGTTISGLKNGTIPANMLGDYAYDLWILPSLNN